MSTHLGTNTHRASSGSAHGLVGLIAIALLVTGLFAGFSEITVDGRTCGSAFIADEPDGSFVDAPAECDDRRGDRQLVAIGLLVGGGAAGIWALGQTNPPPRAGRGRS